MSKSSSLCLERVMDRRGMRPWLLGVVLCLSAEVSKEHENMCCQGLEKSAVPSHIACKSAAVRVHTMGSNVSDRHRLQKHAPAACLLRAPKGLIEQYTCRTSERACVLSIGPSPPCMLTPC